MKRRSCLVVNAQRAGSSSLLLCLVITALCSCGEVGRRERVAKYRTDRKSAKTSLTTAFNVSKVTCIKRRESLH